MKQLPTYLMTVVFGITSWLLITFVGDIRRDAAKLSTSLETLAKTVHDDRTRIAVLEERHRQMDITSRATLEHQMQILAELKSINNKTKGTE